jgi:hypothetical protein
MDGRFQRVQSVLEGEFDSFSVLQHEIVRYGGLYLDHATLAFGLGSGLKLTV